MRKILVSFLSVYIEEVGLKQAHNCRKFLWEGNFLDTETFWIFFWKSYFPGGGGERGRGRGEGEGVVLACLTSGQS
jgi:hypothetical protein